MSNPTVFKKRSPKTPVNLSTGAHLHFEDLGLGYGYLRTEDPLTIQELNACITGGRAGIEASSIAEYDDAVKKKPGLAASSSKFLREQQTSGLVVPPVTVDVESVEAAAPVAKAEVKVPIAPATPPSPPLGSRKVK